MTRGKGKKGLMSSIPMLSMFGPVPQSLIEDADGAREKTTEGDGSALAERRPRAASARGKEKAEKAPKPASDRKPAEAKRGRPKGSKAAEGGRQTVQTYVRLPEAMLRAVDKAVSDSPIEFGSASEFIRRAVETELRRRGLLANFK